MGRFLYPDAYMASAYSIDYGKLYEMGYRGLIFDIDNTLVPHGAPADKKAVRLFAGLKEMGFRCVLISNNKEPRVKSFSEKAGVLYIYKAAKPKPDAYRRAMGMMHTDTGSTVFIGDQIFTDILGANLAGLRSVLVKPINPKDEIQIVLIRSPEKLVLFFVRMRCKKKREVL